MVFVRARSPNRKRVTRRMSLVRNPLAHLIVQAVLRHGPYGAHGAEIYDTVAQELGPPIRRKAIVALIERLYAHGILEAIGPPIRRRYALTGHSASTQTSPRHPKSIGRATQPRPRAQKGQIPWTTL